LKLKNTRNFFSLDRAGSPEFQAFFCRMLVGGSNYMGVPALFLFKFGLVFFVFFLKKKRRTVISGPFWAF
jgi:hypothetical protein